MSETTPSKWGEGRRDAGHDEMQISFFEHMRKHKFPDKIRPEFSAGRPHGETTRVFSTPEIEFPLIVKGKLSSSIRSFCDIAVEFAESRTYGDSKVASREKKGITIYEIKPKINSVGLILRQVKSQQQIAWDCGYEYAGVVCVVQPTDANLPLLVRAGVSIITWDGKDTAVVIPTEQPA